MNAKDLMPGDLVMSFGQVTEVWMVDASHEDEEDQLINYLGAREFEPIPLTIEILEKIGYKFNYIYYEKEGYPAIELGSEEGTYNVGKVYFSDNGDPDIHVYTTCKYVHELQHALKLCKIEKKHCIMQTINHEYYVSLELAKLLKEAGFDWKQYSFYNSKGILMNGAFTANWNNICYMDGGYGNKVSAPTLEVVQRWLREVKNIDVVVSRAMQWKQFYYTIEHEENRTSKIDFMSLNEDMWWLKYEEALEAGIKKTLELILKKKIICQQEKNC